MTYILSITNQKGGVGKTTLTFNLAHGLAGHGYRVLAVDNDVQANLTSSLLGPADPRTARALSLFEGQIDKPQKVAQNLWLLAGDPELEAVNYEPGLTPRNFADELQRVADTGKLDYIVVDTNPQITDLTLASMMAADHVLVPLEPSKFGLEGLRRVMSEIKKLQTTGASKAELLGIMLNLVERTVLHRNTAAALRKRFGGMVFETQIHKRTSLAECMVKNTPIHEYEPNGKAANEIRLLVKELLNRLEAASA